VSFSGDEAARRGDSRRNAALLQRWAAILPSLTRSASSPESLPAYSFSPQDAHGASAVSLSNRGATPAAGPLYLYDPSVGRQLIVSRVEVPAAKISGCR